VGWSNTGACPFGVVLRPACGEPAAAPPFETWSYAPCYLPSGLVIDVATDAPLTEPAFFHLRIQRGRARQDPEPVAHAIPVVEIANVRIGLPPPGVRSAAARMAESSGLLSFEESRDYTLTLIFDDDRGRCADLRPGLPVVLRW
jgi:hypothetical protein